jgi:hypothetical protein
LLRFGSYAQINTFRLQTRCHLLEQ